MPLEVAWHKFAYQMFFVSDFDLDFDLDLLTSNHLNCPSS